MVIKDFYERFFVKGKSDRHYFRAGRVATLGVIIASLLLVPVVLKVYLIMWLEQLLLAMLLGPFMAILILAIFWPRANTPGSLSGFLTGGALAITLQQIFHVNIFFQISWWSFLTSLIVTIIVSLLTPPPRKEKLDGITWQSNFEAMVGEVIEDRALGQAVRVTEIRVRTIKRPPWYLNLKYWATGILLVQIALLMFFG
jgi:Na+/proline symporter